MADRLPDLITTCTPEEMFHALGCAWVDQFGDHPKTESLLVLLCQWVLETGWGKSCHCWNIGNFKSRDGDGYDYVYYKCDERFTPSVAQHYLAGVQPRSDGSGLPNVAFESHNKDETTTLYFWPDHPVSRFRAFKTKDLGVGNYLASMFDRFHLAWPAILAGDPSAFVHQLKIQGYFTADEETYKKTEVSLFTAFKGKHFSTDDLPILNDADKEQINGLIALTLDQSIRGDSDTGTTANV
jgi:hypothetical protein